MLDKSVPYYNVLLMRKADTPFTEVDIPPGFAVEYFKEGDESSWADIESSVLEFSDSRDALSYFKDEYMKFPKELSRRCVFLVSLKEGQKAGTATAWWSMRNGKKVPSLHWISVNPRFQGRGLGKSMIHEALKRSIKEDGNVDSFIHTQTWSYRAIGIYLSFGYKVLRSGTFGNYSNDYEKALPVLQEKMGKYFSIERDTLDLDQVQQSTGQQ